jgi:hypothetical protein
MDDAVRALVQKMNFAAGGASTEALNGLEAFFGHTLPEEYAAFMAATDGAEGFVKDSDLHLWPAAEIPSSNAEYQVAESAPGFFLIGSNGGGEGIAIRFTGTGCEFGYLPFIGMAADVFVWLGSSFREFLQNLDNPFDARRRSHAPSS